MAPETQAATGLVSTPAARRPFSRLSNTVVPRPLNGMQREWDEHRRQVVSCRQFSEPAVKRFDAVHDGLGSPVDTGRALAEKIQFSRHAVGVIPPGDDVNPVVFRRNRESRRDTLFHGSGSEPLVRGAQCRQKSSARRARKSERHDLARGVTARRKARADLKHVGDFRRRGADQARGLNSVLTNGRSEKAEQVDGASWNGRNVGNPSKAEPMSVDGEGVCFAKNLLSVLKLAERGVHGSIPVRLEYRFIEHFARLFVERATICRVVFNVVDDPKEIPNRGSPSGRTDGLQLHPVRVGAARAVRCRWCDERVHESLVFLRDLSCMTTTRPCVVSFRFVATRSSVGSPS